GRESLGVDEFAPLPQLIGHVPHEGHVGRDLLRRPLVHRDYAARRRLVVATVVLEQQVLGHDVLLGSGAITVAALHNLGRNPGWLFDIWCRPESSSLPAEASAPSAPCPANRDVLAAPSAPAAR